MSPLDGGASKTGDNLMCQILGGFRSGGRPSPLKTKKQGFVATTTEDSAKGSADSRQVDCGKDRHPLPLVNLEAGLGIRPPAGLVVFFGFVGAPGLVLAHID